jgi:hypothetical protein
VKETRVNESETARDWSFPNMDACNIPVPDEGVFPTLFTASTARIELDVGGLPHTHNLPSGGGSSEGKEGFYPK